jgi:hypothetical protein
MDWMQRLVSLSGSVEDALLVRIASLVAEEPDPAQPCAIVRTE